MNTLIADPILFDITGQQTAQNNMKSNNETNHAILKSMPEGIILQNRHGLTLSCNASAERILGFSEQQLKKQDPNDLPWRALDEDGSALPRNRYPTVISLMTGQIQNNVVMGIHNAHGKLIWLMVNTIPLFHADENQPHAVLTTFIDITERKRTESKRYELAVHLTKTRTILNFMKDISHDLRTPLAIFQTGLYLLRKQPSVAKILQRIEVLEQQANRMQSIIENMDDVIRLDSLASGLHFEPCQLHDLIENVVAEKEAVVLQKNHWLLLDIEDAKTEILADKKELIRALHHLLDNAINYTNNKGKIEIRSRKQTEEMVIEITDYGMGIETNDKHQIFDPFFRGDKARGATTGGAGLGLTVAKAIIEAHRGSIEVESILGQGSTFRVRLPLAKSA